MVDVDEQMGEHDTFNYNTSGQMDDMLDQDRYIEIKKLPMHIQIGQTKVKLSGNLIKSMRETISSGIKRSIRDDSDEEGEEE